jgi:SAM-dependent methyltransferase
MYWKDHFSPSADAYAAHRPTYPDELIDYLGSVAPARDVAWDCGCGTGQLSTLLVRQFQLVIAMDASAQLLARAPRHERIEYREARVEESGLDNASVDLIVSAQAAHWFDLTTWYSEARRVARRGAAIALVTYAVPTIDPAIDSVLRDFHARTLAPFWPAERRHVDLGYASLPFPFAEIAAPRLEIAREWTLDETLAYIDTWSSVKAMLNAGEAGQLLTFRESLAGAWQPPAKKRVTFPLTIRAGRVSDT